ncbi:MAG: hypothetical protein WBG42_08150 [Cryomorphaceae bacterium]
MRLASYFVIIFIALICQSCEEEGCTDPQALNFDATADEDDGSCVYCEEPTISTSIVFTDSLIENRFGSSLFQEKIFELSIEQTESTGIIRQCPASELLCTTEISVRNITEFEMVNFDIDFFISGPQVFQSFFVQDINLESGEDTIVFVEQVDLNFSNCPRYANSSVDNTIFSGIYVE